MADTKASILMGASFVVFSMSIGDLAAGKATLPLLVLTMFSFIATVFGVLTVRPNKMPDKPIPIEKANILFFGSYTNAPRDDYVDEVIKVLSSEEETYRRLAKDLYDHGLILRNDKFRWLYWSFSVFPHRDAGDRGGGDDRAASLKPAFGAIPVGGCRQGPLRCRSSVATARAEPTLPGSATQSGWQK